MLLVAIGLALAAALPAAVTVPARASHIGCGAVLTSAGSPYVLHSDVGPCDDDAGPALTVQSGVTLDLNGFRVYCQDTDGDGSLPDGIVVAGTGASVRNAALNAVNGCHHGVVVTGNGNSFRGGASRDNRYDGWRVEGSNNSFTRNDATGNGKALAACPDETEGGSGFSVHDGSGNTFDSNVSDGNACDGFLIDSDGHQVRANNVNGNGRYGIYIEGGAGGNLILLNNVWGHDEYDMSDENENCDGNTWRLNFFGTADQACIQ